MITLIDDHRLADGVEPICRVLPVAPLPYHDHAVKRLDPSRLSARAKQDEVLKIEVKRVFNWHFSVYGVRKVRLQLRREGPLVASRIVERLMRQLGLKGAVRGNQVRATIGDKSAPCPIDHVQRQFDADVLIDSRWPTSPICPLELDSSTWPSFWLPLSGELPASG